MFKVLISVLGLFILVLACGPSVRADNLPSNLQPIGGTPEIQQVTGGTRVEAYGSTQVNTNHLNPVNASRVIAVVSVPEPSSLLLLVAGLLLLSSLAGRRLLTS